MLTLGAVQFCRMRRELGKQAAYPPFSYMLVCTVPHSKYLLYEHPCADFRVGFLGLYLTITWPASHLPSSLSASPCLRHIVDSCLSSGSPCHLLRPTRVLYKMAFSILRKIQWSLPVELDYRDYRNFTRLTLNEPATTGHIMDRVEVKLDLTSDQ